MPEEPVIMEWSSDEEMGYPPMLIGGFDQQQVAEAISRKIKEMIDRGEPLDRGELIDQGEPFEESHFTIT